MDIDEFLSQEYEKKFPGISIWCVDPEEICIGIFYHGGEPTPYSAKFFTGRPPTPEEILSFYLDNLYEP
jgi:hypothetical protein